MTIKQLEDLNVAGRRVLVRADFNVPFAKGEGPRVITDDGRIRAALPTIEYLVGQGAKVILTAHLGRPKNGPTPELSLAPIATRLAELLGKPVAFASDVTGASAHATVAALQNGEVALLENVRFDPRDQSKVVEERAAMAAELAALADVFVSDGFGVVHREEATVTDIARVLPHGAGRLVFTEAAVFQKVLSNPDRPYVVVLGGSKVSDKLGVIGNLLNVVDELLIGGGMCFTFLAALGHEVGDSLLEVDQLDSVKGFIATAAERGVKLTLPTDIVVADAFDANANHKVVAANAIEPGWRGLDIGPDTQAAFVAAIAEAKTVVWNGPMGVFEMPAFAGGTIAVASSMAANESAMTVVGGGDSAAAVRTLGLNEAAFTHISTGGGASLEFLEGKTLPGIAVLED